jgi:hypothetical protein
MIADEYKPKKARVTKERDVRTHAELWHTSNCLLDAGREQIQGSAHQFRASLIFRAFCVEALLNWLGAHLIQHWKYLERLKPQEKLDLLCDVLQLEPDYASRPWQIVKELFAFRNALAHGKPETLRDESLEDMDDHLDRKLGDFLRTDWERLCTEQNAVKAQEDVRDIVTLLFNKVNALKMLEGPLDPFSGGFQHHSAQL